MISKINLAIILIFRVRIGFYLIILSFYFKLGKLSWEINLIKFANFKFIHVFQFNFFFILCLIFLLDYRYLNFDKISYFTLISIKILKYNSKVIIKLCKRYFCKFSIIFFFFVKIKFLFIL